MPIVTKRLESIPKVGKPAVRVREDVTISGTFSGSIENDGVAPVQGKISMVVFDDAGHSQHNDIPVRIASKKTYEISFENPLLVSYEQVGIKTVTASMTIDFDAAQKISHSTSITVTAH